MGVGWVTECLRGSRVGVSCHALPPAYPALSRLVHTHNNRDTTFHSDISESISRSVYQYLNGKSVQDSLWQAERIDAYPPFLIRPPQAQSQPTSPTSYLFVYIGPFVPGCLSLFSPVHHTRFHVTMVCLSLLFPPITYAAAYLALDT